MSMVRDCAIFWGTFFMIESGFMGMVFKIFMDIVFCEGSFTGELFWDLRIYGYDFQGSFRIYGYTFEKFLPIYGW